MAKIPIILEAGRADGKLIKTNSVYDDNQEKFLSDKIKEIDNSHNKLNDTVNSLTDTVNNNELDIENKLETEQNRATNVENNLRETINNITEISGSATTAKIVTIDTIPNSSSSNVQQALNELFEADEELNTAIEEEKAAIMGTGRIADKAITTEKLADGVIVQETGESTNTVMSQKAVSDIFAKVFDNSINGESLFVSNSNKSANINVDIQEDAEVYISVVSEKTIQSFTFYSADYASTLGTIKYSNTINKLITIPTGTKIIQATSNSAGDGTEKLNWKITFKTLTSDIGDINANIGDLRNNQEKLVSVSGISFYYSKDVLPNIDTKNKTIDFGDNFSIVTRDSYYNIKDRNVNLVDETVKSSVQVLVFDIVSKQFQIRLYSSKIAETEIIVAITRVSDNIDFVFKNIWCPFDYTIDGESMQSKLDTMLSCEEGTSVFSSKDNRAATIVKQYNKDTIIKFDLVASEKTLVKVSCFDKSYHLLREMPINATSIYNIPINTHYIQVVSDKSGTGEEVLKWKIYKGTVIDQLLDNFDYTDATKVHLQNSITAIDEEVKNDYKAIPSKEGENIFVSSYRFDGNSFYRITAWSEEEIICTQFSLMTAIGSCLNKDLIKYDGTPIVVEHYVATDTVGNIKVWISNNQSKGTKIFYKVEKLLNDKDYSNAGSTEDGTSKFNASELTSANIYKYFLADTQVLLSFNTDKTIREIKCYTLNWSLLKTISYEDTINKPVTIPKETQLLQIVSTTAGTGEEELKWSITTGQKIYNVLAAKAASGVKDTTLVVERNSDKISALVSSCRLNGLRGSDSTSTSLVPKKDIQMLICTDHHGDNLALSNAVDALNGFDTIDYMLIPGDLGGGWYNKTIGTKMYKVLANAKKPYFVAIGNHDVGTSVVIEHCCDHNIAYDDFIKPMVDSGILVSGEHSSNNCYYYHDFIDSKHNKIRLIVLYEFDDDMAIDETYWRVIPYDDSLPIIGNNGTSYNTGDKVRLADYTTYAFQAVQNVTLSTTSEWSNTTRPAYKMPRGIRVIRKEQFDWFLNTLASTPEGYGVIVVSHQPISPNFETQDVMFQNPHINKIGQANAMYDYIAEAVNAFTNRSNFVKTINVSAQIKHEGFSYNVAQDFTNAKGTFITYVGGHLHYDGVFKHKTYNQYAIHPAASKTWGYGSTDYGEDIAHSNVNDVAYDCLTVISPNTDRIALVKIGATRTIDGSIRDFEVIKIN